MRETAVLMFATIYWGGVIINVYRVRRRIGRSPNLMKFRSLKDGLLSLCWGLIIGGWFVQPILMIQQRQTLLFAASESLLMPPLAVTGILLALAGYMGTLWCYTTLGDSWRLGVSGEERTILVQKGIYRWVRHPIYSFQIMILSGMTLLLPTFFSIIILVVHYAAISVMSRDEEAYLKAVHGTEYRTYFRSSGRFFPKVGR